jgi:hypothetical protein
MTQPDSTDALWEEGPLGWCWVVRGSWVCCRRGAQSASRRGVGGPRRLLLCVRRHHPHRPAGACHARQSGATRGNASTRYCAAIRRRSEDFEGACEGACELLKHRFGLRGGARGGAGAGVLEGGLDASGLRRTLSVGPYTLRSRTERALPRRCAPISLPIFSMLDSHEESAPSHTVFGVRAQSIGGAAGRHASPRACVRALHPGGGGRRWRPRFDGSAAALDGAADGLPGGE